MTRAYLAAAMLTFAGCAASLAAQGSCSITMDKPFQIQSAALYLLRHDQQQASADERTKALRQAVKVLTDNPGRIKNEAARSMLLGAAYVRWFADQGATPVLSAKRGDLGFSDNPEGEFSLPVALDEAMSAVEREAPACADSTARYRAAVFTKALNLAISAYNAKAYPSAVAFANAALQLKPRGSMVAGAYQVLANAAQAQGDVAGAIGNYEKFIASSEQTAATAPSRATATFNLAVMTRDQALKLDAASRAPGLQRAAGLFKQAAELAPDGPNAATARAAYARTLQEAGAGEAPVDVYTDMRSNPGRYTAIQLFEAGVVMANASKFEDAARFYEAGLQTNPWYRDALFNVANVYLALHQPEKMAPVVERLRSSDPMNPDVLKLAGAVWQERAGQASDARRRAAAQDSTAAYLRRAAKLPARVAVTQFSVGRDNTATISGTVQNLGAATASFTVIFDLVDKGGNSVGSTTVVTDPVAAKATTEFSVKAAGASPVAWRYQMR